jgi:hypothetical protein
MIKLISIDSNIKLMDKNIIFCFGMSKMTIEKENENNNKYFEL